MLATIVNFVGNFDMSSLEYWTGHVEYFTYLVAALLLAVALASLSHQETALHGNKFGVAGMVITLVFVILVALAIQDAGAITVTPMPVIALLIVGCMGLGAIIGLHKAKIVQTTGMPELIALLYSPVRFTVVLVGFNIFMELSAATDPGLVTDMGFHLGEVDIGVFIGAVTFIGPITMYLKLSGKMKGKPLILPGWNLLNVLMLLTTVIMIVWMIAARHMVETAADPAMLEQQWTTLGVPTAISLVSGLHLVAAIGGEDMPVAVSMLNSYSGRAAAVAGFMLSNPLLITVGALVGSLGAFLPYIMCKGMEWSLAPMILSRLGEGAGSARETKEYGEYHEIKTFEATNPLKGVKSMVTIPDYGMATAGAQFAVTDLTKKLRDLGVQVRLGIHPMVECLLGYMNVLLVEAKAPYNIVLGMDETNGDFLNMDAVLVIGANDTVNPDAYEPGSPIAGTPVLHVWEVGRAITSKRSMATGYARVQNPLFLKENTDTPFGDAKASTEEIIKNLQLGCDGGSGGRPGVATAFSSQFNTHVAPNS